MVKPPKSMQPELVDLSKAGRRSGSAFQENSFHQYMARKIDLQRHQFGLVLPPPPPSSSSKARQSRKRPRPYHPPPTQQQAQNQQDNPHRNPHTKTFIPNKPKISQKPNSQKEENNDYDDETKPAKSMRQILRRLQRRHGTGNPIPQQRKQQHSYSSTRFADPFLFSDMDENDGSDDDDDEDDSDGGAINDKDEEQRGDTSAKETSDEGEDGENKDEAEQHGGTSIEEEEQIDDNDDEDDDDNTDDGDVHIEDSNIAYMSLSSTRKRRPDLFFLGIVVKVNGYTTPDNESLKRLLQRHGGDLETYETTRVTHIIAQSMSTAKANHMKKQKKPRPVVKPAWIVDSVEAQQLLPHGDYLLLDELPDKGKGQRGIKDMFSYAQTVPSDKSTAASTSEKDQLTTENKAQQEQKATKHVQGTSSTEPENGKSSSSTTCSTHSQPIKTSTLDPCKESESRTLNDSALSVVQTEKSTTTSDTSPQQGRTDGKNINGRIRTTGTDPHFLESFFKNSRLSFIGSYRQRTQQHDGTRAPGSLKAKLSSRFVFHVDMDCFFANVVLRNYPQYRDKPVAISHHGKRKDDDQDTSEFQAPSSTSTSECATCNYHARKFGIKKGMFLGRARQLCPELIVLQYDFAGYEEVSEQVLSILQRVAVEHDGCVEAVSCDEAYMELFVPSGESVEAGAPAPTSANHVRAGDIAEMVRKEIFETTQCTASIGVARNKFLAKVGTDKVKPNGSYVVTNFQELLENMKLRDLHGVGYRSEPKLAAEGLEMVQDVWDLGARGESILTRILGPGLGKKIYDFCYGKDDREVKAAERKTIGAECNYGVRFDGPYGVEHFFNGLATEVEKRMEAVGCLGSKLTLKVKQRKQGAKPPPKFLGHGSCHNLSKSADMPGLIPTRDSRTLSEVAMSLFQDLSVPLDDVRGMGIIISNLTLNDGVSCAAKQGNAPTGIASFFKNTTTCGDDGEISSNGVSSMQENRLDGEKDSDDDVAYHDEDSPNKSVEETVFDDEEKKEEAVFQVSPVPAKGPPAKATAASRTASPGRLALPSLSQIHMSQVDALPLYLQEEIRLQVASDVTKRQRHDVSKQNAVKQEEDRQSELGFRRLAMMKSISNDAGQKGKHSFRQIDLKRMMKLTAIRSGDQDVQGVSLTQLDQLPLEIQLQVANNDSNPLGKLPRNSTRKSWPSGTNGKRQSSSNALSTSSSRINRAIELTKEKAISGKVTAPIVQQEEEDEVSMPPTDLFEDDILPLQIFLDSNSPTDCEAVETVCAFFKTCLTERRMNAVGPLIRSTRNRTDGWSDGLMIQKLAKALDEEHSKIYKSKLDIQWLTRE